MNDNEFVWAQRYRPRTIDECILPEATKAFAKDLVTKKELPHLILSGGPGMGKTTLAYALAAELGSDLLYINASLENGIDVLRTKIQGFASTYSLEDTGTPKIVFLDEADGLTPVMQNGLKAFLEAFSANCRFVFTANHKHKLIEPLHSRCTHIDFKMEPKEKATIARDMFSRCISILKENHVEYDKAVVAELVKRNFPDFRKTLNELQRHSVSGKIDSYALVNHGDEMYVELFDFMKDKNITEIRKWIAKNDDVDSPTLFRKLYDIGVTKFTPSGVASMILILADYGYKAAFVVDHQINKTACIVEIISSCEFS